MCGDPDLIKPDCPHRTLQCQQCGKLGHLQQVCMTGFLHVMPKKKTPRGISFRHVDVEAERQRAESRAEWEADRVRRQAELDRELLEDNAPAVQGAVRAAPSGLDARFGKR